MIDHSRYRVASAHDKTTAASSKPIRDGRDMGGIPADEAAEHPLPVAVDRGGGQVRS
jgi:hypothetical protein